MTDRALKRAYVNASKARHAHQTILQNLQEAGALVPKELLEPAIDFMFDIAEESERVWREVLKACLAKGIRKAYGHGLSECLLAEDPELDTNNGETPSLEHR